MKRKLIYTFLAALTLLVSCEKFDEVHQEYLEGGEIIYSVKPDSIVVLPGLNRCLVTAKMVTTPNLDKFVIEWNDEQLVTDIEQQGDTAFIEVEVNNIDEGAVIFNVYSIDKQGNVSVPSNAFGNVYGEKYQKNLLPRNIIELKGVQKGAIVKFSSSPEKSVGIELTYTDNDDQEHELIIKPGEIDVELTNAKYGTEFSYVTLYWPDENCLDTIQTLNAATETIPFPELKEKNIELDASTILHLDNDAVKAAWGNGESGLFEWNYTTYCAYESGLPYIITLDMGNIIPLTKFKLLSRLSSDAHYYGHGNAHKFRLFGAAELPAGTSLDDWDLLGTYEINKPSGGDGLTDEDRAYAENGFDCIIADQPQVRYIRIVVDETFNPASTNMYTAGLKFLGMMY